MAETEKAAGQLVPIRTEMEPVRARMIKSLLDAQDIPAFLVGEHMASMNYAVTADVLVRAEDEERALELLKTVAVMPAARQQQMLGQVEEVGCPHCGSEMVRGHVGPMPSSVPFLKREAKPAEDWFHCRECGSYFQLERKRFRSLPVALMWSLAMGALTFGFLLILKFLPYLSSRF